MTNIKTHESRLHCKKGIKFLLNLRAHRGGEEESSFPRRLLNSLKLFHSN